MTSVSPVINLTQRPFSSSPSKFNSKQSRRLVRLILARKTSLTLSSTGSQSKSLSLHNSQAFQSNFKKIRRAIVSQSNQHAVNPNRRMFTLKVGSFSRSFPSLSFKTPVFTPSGLISRSKNRSKLFFKSKYYLNRSEPTRALVSAHDSLSGPSKFPKLSTLRLPHSLTTQLANSYNSSLRRARLIRRVRLKSRRATPYNTLDSDCYYIFRTNSGQSRSKERLSYRQSSG